MSKFRIDMISEEVRREADKIIREDMHDPRLGGTYCITRAEVTRDLRYAKMYVSILEDDKAEGVIAALKSGAGFIRRELGHRLSLRYTPELLFVRDQNIAYGVHVAAVLRDIAPKTEESDQNQNNLYTEKVLSALKNADNFMICAHIYPDGDAIGSLLALGRLLDKLGKTVTLVSADGVPKDLMCLPDAARVLTPDQARNRAFGMAIAVDVSDEKRMGAAAELFFAAPQTLLIDHHATNTRFAQMNVVDGQAAATAEPIVMLYDTLNVPLDADAAFQLYCALQSDSGNFCFNSVRAYTFACMEKLMDAGLDLASAARRLFLTKSRAHIAALGKAIGSMVYFADGQATCMHLSAQDKADCGAQDADLGGIVNYALYMDGVRMCFMADEDAQGNWKYSLRALPGEDVSDIARSFGGGGHALASGCTIAGPYADSSRAMMNAMEKKLLK